MLEFYLSSKTLLASGANYGMLALSFGKAEHGLTMGTLSVSEGFEVAYAILCKDEEILSCAKDLHKSVVFPSSSVYIA